MGIMLETPTGAFKNLIVDNVAKLEDSMAHFMPELPLQHRCTPMQYSF